MNLPKKAMVLAAGKGTRLGEVANSTPKSLVSAGGKTMLEHTLERLIETGVEDVVINLHHLSDKVENFLEAHPYPKLNISFSYEDVLLDTGGGLKKAAPFFSDSKNFFLHNCDIYTDYSLRNLWNTHLETGAFASLLVMERKTERYLVFDQEYHLVGWKNFATGATHYIDPKYEDSATLSYLAFCGIQVLSNKIFRFMENQEEVFSIISTLLFAASEGAVIQAVRIDPYYWIDVGTMEKLQTLHSYLSEL